MLMLKRNHVYNVSHIYSNSTKHRTECSGWEGKFCRYLYDFQTPVFNNKLKLAPFISIVLVEKHTSDTNISKSCKIKTKTIPKQKANEKNMLHF